MGTVAQEMTLHLVGPISIFSLMLHSRADSALSIEKMPSTILNETTTAQLGDGGKGPSGSTGKPLHKAAQAVGSFTFTCVGNSNCEEVVDRSGGVQVVHFNRMSIHDDLGIVYVVSRSLWVRLVGGLLMLPNLVVV